MPRSALSPALALLLLTLVGCGARQADVAAIQPGSPVLSIALPNASGPIVRVAGLDVTAIDAATHDAAGMPAQATGPSAYDRARAALPRLDRAPRRRRGGSPDVLVPASTMASFGDIFGVDETLTTGG